jgi:hypothetical protein
METWGVYQFDVELILYFNITFMALFFKSVELICLVLLRIREKNFRELLDELWSQRRQIYRGKRQILI